jgi:hypothetical protein
MEKGQVVRPVESLETIRARFESDRTALPLPYRAVRAGERYPVLISAALQALEEETEQAAVAKELV